MSPLDTAWFELNRFLDLGGPVVVILILISIIGLAIVLFKYIQFGRVSPRKLNLLQQAIELWYQGKRDECHRQLDSSTLAVADIVRFGLTTLNKDNADNLKDELARRGNIFLQPYASLLKPLELIYYLAPILGLLGTVLGMIEAFRGLAVGGNQGESAVLAGGIWQALLTTAVGLSIAIPFAVMHSSLEGRLNKLANQVEDLLTLVFTASLNHHGENDD